MRKILITILLVFLCVGNVHAKESANPIYRFLVTTLSGVVEGENILTKEGRKKVWETHKDRIQACVDGTGSCPPSQTNTWSKI